MCSTSHSVFNFGYFIAKQGVSSFQIEVVVVSFINFDRSMQIKLATLIKEYLVPTSRYTTCYFDVQSCCCFPVWCSSDESNLITPSSLASILCSMCATYYRALLGFLCNCSYTQQRLTLAKMRVLKILVLQVI